MVTKMDDFKLALLGNHEAANRLTDAGDLLPCMHGSGAFVYNTGNYWPETFYRVISNNMCCMQAGLYSSEQEARLAWNIRSSILSAEEMEALKNG